MSAPLSQQHPTFSKGWFKRNLADARKEVRRRPDWMKRLSTTLKNHQRLKNMSNIVWTSSDGRLEILRLYEAAFCLKYDGHIVIENASWRNCVSYAWSEFRVGEPEDMAI